MTITGLELRRAMWEALGWRRDRDGDGWWHSPKCKTDQSGHRDYAAPDQCDYPSHQREENLPSIESSNGIALDELVKVCEKHGYVADIRILPSGTTAVLLRQMSSADWIVDESGEKPAEAICRALIQAASVKANVR